MAVEIVESPRPDERGPAEMDFMECPTCAAKPGSPTLCDSCLHNRSLIGVLQRKIARKEKWQRLLSSIIEMAGDT